MEVNCPNYTFPSVFPQNWYVLNENTGIREIKVYKSKEIKPEQDMSSYEFLVNQQCCRKGVCTPKWCFSTSVWCGKI